MGYLLASQLGLAICVAMLASFVRLDQLLRPATRLWLLGISVFGLLQYGSVSADYQQYRNAHEAQVTHSYRTLAGVIERYDTLNTHGAVSLQVQGETIYATTDQTSGIKRGDSIRLQLYSPPGEQDHIMQLDINSASSLP